MDVLFARIVELDLPLKMDDPTPGRGNCLFAAMCQQFRRPEVGLPNLYMAASLRKSVCEFALALQDPRVVGMSGHHNNIANEAKRRPWDRYFQDMKKNGTFGEEPVLFCLAWMLGRDIIVISNKCTNQNPWMFIDGSGSKFAPILLANEVGIHFQSALPTDRFDTYLESSDIDLKVSAPYYSLPARSSTPLPSPTPSTFEAPTSTPHTQASSVTTPKRKLPFDTQSIPSSSKRSTPTLLDISKMSAMTQNGEERLSMLQSSLTATFESQLRELEEFKSSIRFNHNEMMNLAKSAVKSGAEDISTLIRENRKLHATVLTQSYRVMDYEEKKRKDEELTQRENQLSNREQVLEKREYAVVKKENELKVREESLKKREVDVKNKEFEQLMGDDSCPDDSFLSVL